MERLSGMDASFLYTETPTGHMHVTGVIVIDGAEMTGGYRFDRLVTMIGGRLHRLPPFRRRLVEVPLSFDHPVWIDDTEFRLDYHVRHTSLPRPGSLQQLRKVAARNQGQRLDR